MPKFCSDLQIHVNGQQTFFLKERIISAYSGRLKNIIKQAKKKTQIKKSGIEIEINEFPGGPAGFELASRFCYNNGRIKISVSNVSILHCSAVFLGMTEKLSTFNLLQQTESFLKGIFHWSWNDIIVSLKSCESFFAYADSYGPVQNLITALIAKIAQNSDINIIASSSSSSSSPETTPRFRFSSSSKNTPESIKPYSKSTKEWWFDDMAILAPKIIEKVIKNLGAYGTDNNSLILTRFLLHYLKITVQSKRCKISASIMNSKGDYVGLVETAIHGVILVGKTTFSCRKLFWVLRVVSDFSLSRDCRDGLERLIGEILDQATLDDLLVSGRDRGVYDVNLVIRLLRVFVNYSDDGVPVQKMKKVGRLIDKYLGEISPDQNLKISKFLGVAESLPDSARDCFDGVYRAIDIYLESHPSLSLEEKSKLCRCLNYEKLTLETCKDLAKNPRIPPNITVQALMSQRSKIIPTPPTTTTDQFVYDQSPISCKGNSHDQMILYKGIDSVDDHFEEESEDIKLNILRMQWRVVELEKVCRDMKSQMSKMVRHNNVVISSPTAHNRALPRLC